MTQRKASTGSLRDYYDVEKNAEMVLTLFNSYYRAHTHSGKLYDSVPDFFLFKPEVLTGEEVATRNSEKLLLDDCIRRAKEREGFIGVTKHFNAKLGYYWLELSAMPFMLGDVVTEENKGEFFYITDRAFFARLSCKDKDMFDAVGCDRARLFFHLI